MAGGIFIDPTDEKNEYKYEVLDPNNYIKLTTDKTTIFKENKAEKGLFTPPKNYEKFTNLNFDNEKSDISKKLLTRKSILNNYDINYMNNYKTVIFDANGGSFKNKKDKLIEEFEENTEIKITTAPTKKGHTFLHWTNNNKKYNPNDKYTLKENTTFKATYENTPPTLEVKNHEIKQNEILDLKTLIKKAKDKEDGNLKEKVKIDKGNFDNRKIGIYKIKFTLTDLGGKTVIKEALVTVKATKKIPNDFPKEKITTEYVDENGKKLLQTTVDTKKSDKKEIKGYTFLKEEKTKTGFKYIYKKNKIYPFVPKTPKENKTQTPLIPLEKSKKIEKINENNKNTKNTKKFKTKKNKTQKLPKTNISSISLLTFILTTSLLTISKNKRK